jgi:Cu(I)/Ag(I) efflux system protein CusF
MRSLVVTTALFIVSALTAPAFAQQSGMGGMKDEMKDMDMSKPAPMSPQTVHKGTGVVKKLDLTASTVTISHGPVATMNWPAMSMTFKVKDKALLNKLAMDKKVDFQFVQQGKDFVVTDAR